MANVWKLAIRANASQAKREIKGLGGSISKLGGPTKMMAAAFVAAAAAVAFATKEAINYGDWLEKTAQKTGMTVEALSQYRLGAELAGTSQEALVSGLQRLQKNMGAALRSPTSAAAVAFKNLGVEFTDSEGNLRDLDGLLPEVAEAMSKMKDGTLKTGTAMDLMGRQGAELIPFLNAGADGLAAMRLESDQLNQTWSTESAQAAAEFNDEVTRLKATLSGMFNVMVQSWLPTLADLVAGINLAMGALAGAEKSTEKWSNTVQGQIGLVSEQIANEEDNVIALRASIKALEEKGRASKKFTTKQRADLGKLRGELKQSEARLHTYEIGLVAVRKEFATANEIALQASQALAAIGSDADQARMEVVTDGIKKLTKSFLSTEEQILKTRNAQLTLIDDWYNLQKAMGVDVAEEAWRLAGIAQQRYLDGLKALNKGTRSSSRRRRKDRNAELKATIKRIDEEIQAHKDAQRTEEQALNDKLQAMQDANEAALDKKIITEQEAVRRMTEIWMIEADEKVRIKTEEAERLRAIEVAEAELRAQNRAEDAAQDAQYVADTKQARVDVIESIGATASAMGSIIKSLSEEGNEEAAKAAKVMFGITQAASLAVAIIKMAEAIAVANAAGPAPFNIPSIVSAIAVGTASIATITAATISGLAHAGLPPGAIAAMGGNEATMIVRRDEMLLDPVGTSIITKMLSDRAGGGQPVQVNTTLEIDGAVLGHTVDTHLIRSQERGLGYENRVRY